MSLRSRGGWRARSCAWLVRSALVLCPGAALAGLSLGEAIERHEARLADEPIPAIEASMPPPGITLAVARRIPWSPALLGRPLNGETGLQWHLHGPLDAPGLRWRLGGLLRESAQPHFSLDGSAVSVPFGPGRAYASMQRRHWGPAWTGSLILDGAAPAVPAIGWRKEDGARSPSDWLSWLGPWGADVFFGQLANPLGPRHVKLIGMRLQVEPLAGLEIGLSRVLQWGGQGRPETLRSLLAGLFGYDNVDGSDHSAEPGNQLAGVDLRHTLRLWEHGTVSAYGQAIGEDEAHKWPSCYLGSAGLDAAWEHAPGGSLRAFVEVANTMAGGAFGNPSPGTAYQHPLYPAGYSQRARVLGHPAGPDVRLATLGLFGRQGPAAGVLMGHWGRAEAATPQFSSAGELRGLDAELSWRLEPGFGLAVSLSHWRESGARRTGLQLRWQIPLP